VKIKSRIYFILSLILFLHLYGCKDKQEPYIHHNEFVTNDSLNSDTIKTKDKVDKKNIIEEKEIIKSDSIKTKPIEKELDSVTIIEQKPGTEIKRTLHSKHFDFNFDNIQDFIVFFNIENEEDTLSYFSIYLSENGTLNNEFDFKFSKKIKRVKSVTTFSDSTVVIKYYFLGSSKIEKLKFKYIPKNKYLLIN